MPTRTSPCAISTTGATAGEEAQHPSTARHLLFVNAGEDLRIIHGHATVALELLQDHPDLESMCVPVGSGTSAVGTCIVRDALVPTCRIVGVQSGAAPAAWRAWRSGKPRAAPCDTGPAGRPPRRRCWASWPTPDVRPSCGIIISGGNADEAELRTLAAD